MHWWYSPNSYNEWIPQDQAAEKLETDQPARGEPAWQAVGCLSHLTPDKSIRGQACEGRQAGIYGCIIFNHMSAACYQAV